MNNAHGDYYLRWMRRNRYNAHSSDPVISKDFHTHTPCLFPSVYWYMCGTLMKEKRARIAWRNLCNSMEKHIYPDFFLIVTLLTGKKKTDFATTRKHVACHPYLRYLGSTHTQTFSGKEKKKRRGTRTREGGE